MTDETVFYRRNLPHFHPKSGIFFITFRLAGSIPKHIIANLMRDRQRQLNVLAKTSKEREFESQKYKLEKRSFATFDQYLDKSAEGPHWLKDNRVARIVTHKVHDLDGQRYHLIAYCIMSNHVHLLIEQTKSHEVTRSNIAGKTKNYFLADTLRLLKGSTARLCNKELGRSGAFWHHESYDHYVRDDEEVGRIVEYILYNPVKAGLVEAWQDWKFTYWNAEVELT